MTFRGCRSGKVKSMKRILHVITTIERGGAEKQLLNLLVAASKSEGFEFYIAFLSGRPDLATELRVAGVKEIYDFSKLSSLRQIIALKKLISREQFNCIHAHLPRSELFVRLASKSRPFLVTRHNSESFVNLRLPGSTLIARWLSRYVTSGAQTVIMISESVKEFLVSKGEIASGTKIATIMYGVNLHNQKRRDFESFTTSSPRPLIFGSVGRLVKQKNFPFLIKAFSAHQDERDSILRIYGRGVEERRIKSLIQKMGCSDKIYLCGTTPKIEDAFMAMDAFVLASAYEGFGLVYLEAMNANLPILCSDIPTNREIFGENFPGMFTLESTKQLESLFQKMRDAHFRNLLVGYQESVLKKFDIEKTSSAHLKIWDRF